MACIFGRLHACLCQSFETCLCQVATMQVQCIYRHDLIWFLLLLYSFATYFSSFPSTSQSSQSAKMCQDMPCQDCPLCCTRMPLRWCQCPNFQSPGATALHPQWCPVRKQRLLLDEPSTQAQRGAQHPPQNNAKSIQSKSSEFLREDATRCYQALRFVNLQFWCRPLRSGS